MANDKGSYEYNVGKGCIALLAMFVFIAVSFIFFLFHIFD